MLVAPNMTTLLTQVGDSHLTGERAETFSVAVIVGVMNVYKRINSMNLLVKALKPARLCAEERAAGKTS
jgi:hypothetical protein